MSDQVSVSSSQLAHPYHLVSPSIWPLAAAASGGLLAVGALLLMHADMSWMLYLGLAALIGVAAMWWYSVVGESVHQKQHTRVVKIGLRYGMALFILSEVMFFFVFFWAFYGAALFPRIVDFTLFDLPLEAALNPQGVWPPPGIEVIDAFDLPLMMTTILLLSGVTVTWAHHAIVEGKLKEAQQALGLTVFLGLLFFGFQVYEYGHASFGFRDGIYPTTFFMATGFHGFHVLVGVIFLAVCWVRTTLGHFSPSSHFGFEAAAWYWHFVDVVWLFLFVSIYWWGAIGTH